MLWYVAFIAGLNLALGYLWAAYLRPCPRCAKIRELGAVIAGASAGNESKSPPTASTPAAIQTGTVEAEATTKTTTAVSEDVPDEVAPEPTAATLAEDPAINDAIEAPQDMAPRDPATGLATLEYAQQLLEQLASSLADSDPLTVALVEVDEIEWTGDSTHEVIDERVLTGVSNVVRESLSTAHTAARFSNQQLLLLVPHENLQQATQRAEELRQRIATTAFMADDRTVQTTVTCALAEASPDNYNNRLFDFLQEALSEAKRYGGNRTFMHDGNSPTPVVPPELDVPPQQLAI